MLTPPPNPQETPQPTLQETQIPQVSPTPQSSQENTLQNAVEKGITYCEGLSYDQNSQEPYGLLMLNVMYRRFGIAAFNDSLQRYDALIDLAPSITAGWLRVFRHIASYNNTLQPGDTLQVTDPVDQLTVPALYCNQAPLPDDYSEMLQQAVSDGGDMLTHAVLACIWIEENGCPLPVSSSFTENMYQATAALINSSVVTDLELEAAAFLYLARARRTS